jgi:hypothetical protein
LIQLSLGHFHWMKMVSILYISILSDAPLASLSEKIRLLQCHFPLHMARTF